jgi:hypothetical protein
MYDKSKITDEIILFEENRRMNGYSLNVLDDWGQKIKKHAITEEEKEKYLETFGKKMITETEFFNWWKTINKSITKK